MDRTPTDPIEAAVARVRANATGYAVWDALYSGAHPTRWLEDRHRSKYAEFLADAVLNVCPGVVDAHADRLSVVGFQTSDLPDGADADEAGAHAWAVWTRNRMERRQGEVYQEAFRTGDAYLIVWPDPSNDRLAVIDPNRADRVTVWYDDEARGRIERAAKAWRRPDGTWRLTLYSPDRIEKYAAPVAKDAMPTRRADWEPWQPDGEAWPLRNPYGRVPVFHVANNAPLGGFGRSELADVRPIQHRLNKAVMDLMLTSHLQNFRQRWGTGIQAARDPDTGEEEEPFKAGADILWTVPAPDARFGEFGTADLAQLRDLKLEHQLDAARVSKVPMRYLLQSAAGESGAAKQMDDSPFEAKLVDRQIAFGDVFADALAFALAIEGRAGATLDTQWAPAAPRSDRESWEVAALQLAAGVSPEQILRERDYTEDQIAQILAESGRADADRIAATATAFGVGVG